MENTKSSLIAKNDPDSTSADSFPDTSLRKRSIIIYSLILVSIALAEGVDGLIDLTHDGFNLDVFVDFLLVALVTLGVLYILVSSQNEVRRSQERTETFRLRMEEFREKNRALLRDVSKAIHAQFDVWKLSPEEKKISDLLIRGFSHREIAAQSGKSERTVRNQALAIYRKSGMTGRADLSAFFLQDMIGDLDSSDE